MKELTEGWVDTASDKGRRKEKEATAVLGLGQQGVGGCGGARRLSHSLGMAGAF